MPKRKAINIGRLQGELTRLMNQLSIGGSSLRLQKRVAAACAFIGANPPSGNRQNSLHWTVTQLRQMAGKLEQHGPAPPAPVLARSIDEGRAFYDTREWKAMRLQILIRDGRRCKCCGATPDTGAVMNVDHIKSLRFHWHLRLDPGNLQVLCADCNIGKGNLSIPAF